jgi:hypothetical protein
MSMMSQMPSRKKAKIIQNLKKYSNVVLFSRREEELSQKNNTSHKSNKNLLKKDKKNKSIKLPTPSDDLSTYALKTISSFKTTFDSFSTKMLFPQSSKASLIDKKENKKIFNPYLTITTFRDENNNKNLNITPKKSIFSLTQNIFRIKDNFNSNQRFNTTNNISNKTDYTIKEQQNEINLLKKIKGIHANYPNKKIIKRDEEYLLDLKLKKLQSEKYNTSLMLNKIREFKYSNYLNEQKKEINKTSIENSKNNLEFLTDKINMLNNIKNNYSINISNKLGEYSKFILKYKEKEKINSDSLLNQINNLKKDVKNLQNKIAKKEYEKAQILKWIDFLIKMKEKKLVLPAYYKKIIETHFERKKEKRKTIAIKLENLKLLHNNEQKFIFYHEDKFPTKDHSNKLLAHVRLSTYNNDISSFQSDKTKKNVESKFKNKKLKLVTKSTISFKRNNYKNSLIKQSEPNPNHHIFNFDESFETNKKMKKTFDKLIQDGINSNEINRISRYKLYLIYNTPDDLEDRLNELQNENIQLLHQYEVSRKKLFAKRLKYKDIFDNRIGTDYEDINNRIRQREIRLNQVMKKHENFLKQFEYAKKSLVEKKNVVNIKQKRNKSLNKKPITKESLRKELLKKIENIYELCVKNIEDRQRFEDYEQKFKKDIIFMLTVIELFVVYLKSKLNFNDKSDIAKYDLMKKIKNDIEHRHKIEKGIILRLKEKERFLTFQEIIEEKMNKILFLQKRRIIPVYNLVNVNKKKKYSVEKKINFEDLMFD